MDLGRKMPSPEEMYPTAEKSTAKDEKTYTYVCVPLKILDGKKIKKGDKIKICLEGEITAIHDDEYREELTMKAEAGEILEGGQESGEDEEGGSYLGKG